jgi:hypothetical protein
MRWSCDRCNLTDIRKADMVAAVARYGADYSTSQFMRDLHCRKCGRKIGLLTESPEERAENARIFGASVQAKFDNLTPTLP